MIKVLQSMWDWFDDRTGTAKLVGPILKHPVPPDTGWPYTLGSATLVAFVIQVVTGIGLSTSYVASTADAYNSLQFITHDAPFGHLLRGMHFWGASAMVLLIGLHTLRTFLYGSYKFPREVSWLTGVLLLGLTLGLAFTGQLLRWDQTAYWSVIVGAKQADQAPLIGNALADFVRAGSTIGGATLTRFFALHVFFIPAGIFMFIGLHIFLVLRNGISEPPKAGEPVDPKTYRQKYQELLHKRGVPFWPDAMFPDMLMGFAVLVVVFALAIIFGPAELGKPPDPTVLQAYPRPDWYFLWYFAVLALIPPAAEPYVIILGPLLFGVVMLALPFFANKGERSARRRPWALAITFAVVVMIGVLWYTGEQAPWSPAFASQPLTAQVVNSTNPSIVKGAQLFHDRGCIVCHSMGSAPGGARGPNLNYVGSRLTRDQTVIRILNGGTDMPAYGSILTPVELNALVDFLQSRKSP